jgi:hypothetical protein
MSEFEVYAQNVTSGLDLPEAAKNRIAEEVVAHLEDEARRCMTQNMSRPEAERTAIERFGREQTIGLLVSQAMERRQVRHRLLQNLRMAATAGLCVTVSLAIGVWAQAFNDAVSQGDFMKSLPVMVGPTIYIGGCTGCVALLTAIVAAIFRVRWSLAIASSVIVLLVFLASAWVFDTAIAPRLLADFKGRESEFIRLVDSFSSRLYLCAAPTCVTGILMLALARRRAYVWRLGVTLAVGLVSTLFMCIDGLPYQTPWTYATKWPKLLAAGLLTLVFVLLAGFLARAIAERFGGQLDRPESPGRLREANDPVAMA